MRITYLLKSFFRSDVRDRGVPYAYNGSVRIVQGSATSIWATVEGSSRYNVSVVKKGNELHLACSCPYFLDRGVGCKHLWATLLVAEQRGYLRGLAHQPGFQVLWDEDDSSLPSEFQEDNDDEDGDDEEEIRPRRVVVRSTKKIREPRKKKAPDGIAVLRGIKAKIERQQAHDETIPGATEWQPVYIIDLAKSKGRDGIVLELAQRTRKKDGDWSVPRFHSVSRDQAERVREEPDATILPLLYGAKEAPTYTGYGFYSSYHFGSDRETSRFNLSPARARSILPLLGRSGRLYIRRGSDKADIAPLAWDDGPPWEFRLRIEPGSLAGAYKMSGWLHRGEEREPISRVSTLLPGVAIWDGRASLLNAPDAVPWLEALRKTPVLAIPLEKRDGFLRDLFLTPNLPPIDVPEHLRVVQETGVPTPSIVIHAPNSSGLRSRGDLEAELSFDYEGQSLSAASLEKGIYLPEARRLIVRDLVAEGGAVATLAQHGFRRPRFGRRDFSAFELPPRLLPKATRALLDAGWRVEADGKLYRRSGSFKIDVSTNIDWFDLHGEIQFDGQAVSLPRLLQALQRGDKLVPLDDGTLGMLPEDWLKKYGLLAGLGKVEGDHLRFARHQAGLLDALLASLPDVSTDRAFHKATEELRRFEGIDPIDPPTEFIGTLREYQREGLGWLRFLERFGFGGCLADDMGLGKTVQVLALLADRRRRKKTGAKKLPALIVVPRSLIFNWKQEAARFAPRLRVLEHTGLDRPKDSSSFTNFDLVLTTYGTLRRDILLFKDAQFDYCILDEAQNIKNASTDQAKAVRLLQANHRLALSGTPIENHLGELWSLFEFLNPGLLGNSSIFKLAGGGARNPEPETREILARGLRPFLLRRTKSQVAKDLPEKTEQTLYCELEPEQRALYNELRDHVRLSLLKAVDDIGMNRAKIQVLEALLRLRQAACHPGLLDPKKLDAPSAKMDMLLPQLREAIEEGQKTLVFSQFTKFLAILRKTLDREGIAYEYLDGKTRDRQEKVERFQNDPECKLFLISLKAGGVGLNLTAAEYVFLLDPWWNPAVEAQAIDRTHRIGQTKPVFAYRIIARDTVEEKVLELQKSKRDLADAILNASNSVLSNLKREDLEMLLS